MIVPLLSRPMKRRKRKPNERFVIWSREGGDDSGPQFIGYARVSTDDQNLDLQFSALQQIGCLNIYGEKVSGASRKRPGLDHAIADLREGDTLVVWRLDRLARSGYELHTRLTAIDEQKAKFKSIQEGFDFGHYMGKFVLGILGLVAILERDMIVERTRAGVAARQAKGLPHGAPPKFLPRMKVEAKRMLTRKRGPLTGKAVAKKFGLSPNTIYLWMKKGMPIPADGVKRVLADLRK